MGCQDICLDMDYDDENAFSRAIVRVARREHRCCECRETIKPGARYEYATGKSDDRIWDAKTCALCLEVRDALVCGSYIFGLLWEQIREYVFPEWDRLSPIDCLAKVESLEARNKLRSAYSDYKGENA